MSFRLLAITQAADDPATRYRFTQYTRRLQQRGVAAEAVVWPRDRRQRDDVVDLANDFDAVVVFRRLLDAGHGRRLRHAARRLAFDFDDSITRRDSTYGRPWPLLDKVLAFRRMIRLCDSVTAGNSYLAELAAKQSRGPSVHIVPTTVDLAGYPNPLGTTIRRQESWQEPDRVLGWIGQPATSVYLKGLRRPLARLCRRRPELIVRAVSSARIALRDVRTEFRRWNQATEVSELTRFDIGLAPLPDDAWTRGKCGLRLLQYLAGGIPAVASPVGVQARIGQRGAALLASREEDWELAIERILTDEALAAELIATGRRLVEAEFTPDRWIETIVQSWCGWEASPQRRSA